MCSSNAHLLRLTTSLLGTAHPPRNAEGFLFQNIKNLQLQAGKIGIVSFLSWQRAFTSEWDLRHFLWEDTQESPRSSCWLHLAGGRREGGAVLCAHLQSPPSSGILLAQGKPSFLDKNCVYCQRLCQTWSQMRKFHLRETSNFFSLFLKDALYRKVK